MKTVSLPQIHRRVPVAEGGTVLEAALRAGAPFPHGCRSGRCGSCKSELLSGEVEMLQHSPFALTAAERELGTNSRMPRGSQNRCHRRLAG